MNTLKFQRVKSKSLAPPSGVDYAMQIIRHRWGSNFGYSFGTACNSFSKDSYQQKNIENSSDKTSDTDSDAVKDESLLEKDFDFKSIIEDIKQDFASESFKDKVPESSQKDQEQPHEHPYPKQDNSIKSEASEQFEYDYSVAEDIEEYEFIDESDIGKHEVQAEKNLPINLERGKSGVFDLDELLVLLDSLGAQDIVSFPVPPEANFCDHMVVVSAKSRRHLQAINEEMLWVHKRKKSGSDSHLLIEGINKSDWCAMDLGNIVLHVFYGNLRQFYDIESLWMLGPENDPKCRGDNQDPYTLSAEDLFWLETAESKDGSATTLSGLADIGNTDKTDSSPCLENVPSDFPSQEKSTPEHQISDLEAGWGSRPSFSKD
ncbi:ribosomal silencing factor rsfs [Plakobranchus ocellatus]|uniref:Ribosomal silencing factor rsfs n=1 Tax=Plakobranchus ocellatus TaxID=259542 RepID=A0AAV4AXR5_9GAST|nr:ribosomal silencing factor rsfs [Plakobranchus ocellatus]